MRCALAGKTLIIILICSLQTSFAVLAQQGRSDVRPRRAESSANPQTSEPAKPTAPSTTNNWKLITPSVVTGTTGSIAEAAEPMIRVALATDVRSANISTNSQLLTSRDLANSLVSLDVARVHVEARLLSPLAAPPEDRNCQLKLSGLASRPEAETQAKQIAAATNEQTQLVFDDATKTWGLLVGPRRSTEDAEIARDKLEASGFETAVIDLSPQLSRKNELPARDDTLTRQPPGPSKLPETSNSLPSVRLAARTSIPTRELVATRADPRRPFGSGKPVLFASNDEKEPVRFNDRPFRGRIEVFANPRGLLTVVNVLGLEDYVRGLVANELSPGVYPAV